MERAIFLYDGDCGLCSAVVDRLRRMRGGETIDWRAYQGERALPSGVSVAALERWAFLVTADGRRLRGFFAFRELSRRLAGLARWSRLLQLPGMSLPGRLVYRLVARHRRRLSAWLGLRHCPLPPRRI